MVDDDGYLEMMVAVTERAGMEKVLALMLKLTAEISFETPKKRNRGYSCKAASDGSSLRTAELHRRI